MPKKETKEEQIERCVGGGAETSFHRGQRELAEKKAAAKNVETPAEKPADAEAATA